MFRKVQTVAVHADARVLTELFAQAFVGLVVDDQKRLVGILTKMDLVDHLTGSTGRREVERA
jgi:CBS domain-containing protein